VFFPGSDIVSGMFSRFIVNGSIMSGARLALEGDEIHHAARVARVRSGEKVEVFDGRGTAAEAIVVEVTRDRVLLEVGSLISSREAPVEIVLAAALIAPERFELVLQKGCELGVARFIPTITSRVETRVERVQGKAERWQRVILEATKQCGRAVLPRLDDPTPLARLLETETGLVVFDADVQPDPWPARGLTHVTLVIGPEGGLSPDEISSAREAGASVCSLGPRRLRAETAAIAAVTIAETLFGDLPA
jgi:16S rRNA (uracil1498-N3)-methyltransferase